MNVLTTFVFGLANVLGLGFIRVYDATVNSYRDTRDQLKRYAVFTIVMVLVGSVLCRAGEENNSWWLLNLGYVLLTINYALGGLILVLLIKKAIPMILVSKISIATIGQTLALSSKGHAAAGSVEEADKRFTQVFWAIIVSMQAFSLLLTFIPFYRNFPGLLVFMGSIVLVSFTVVALEAKGPWYERYMMGILSLGVVSMVVVVINSILPGELWTRVSGSWTAFRQLEELTARTYWVAFIWFVALIIFAYGVLKVIFRKGAEGSWKALGIGTVLLLFMIFLGPRTEALVRESGPINAPSFKFSMQTIGGQTNSQNSSVQGPYLPNADNDLKVGEAYKFPDNTAVFLYGKDGQLHWFKSPSAFNRHYGCAGNPTPLECHPIYEMPTSVSKRDSRLKGAPIQ